MLKKLLIPFLFLVSGATAEASPNDAHVEARVPKPVATPPVPGYEFLYSLNCTLAPSFSVGDGPRGPRTVIPITGGTFEGPKIKGKLSSIVVGKCQSNDEPFPGTVLNLGADWLWTDSRNRAHPDTRYGLRTDDGANIYIQTFGSAQDDGLIHLHGVFETGSDKYWWLNDIVAVGILKAGASSVKIDMWYVKSPVYKPGQ